MNKIVVFALLCSSQLQAASTAPAPYTKEWIHQQYLSFLRKPGSPNPYADYYATHPVELQALKDQLRELKLATPQDKAAIKRLEEFISIATRSTGPVPALTQTYRKWLETMVRK